MRAVKVSTAQLGARLGRLFARAGRVLSIHSVTSSASETHLRISDSVQRPIFLYITVEPQGPALFQIRDAKHGRAEALLDDWGSGPGVGGSRINLIQVEEPQTPMPQSILHNPGPARLQLAFYS